MKTMYMSVRGSIVTLDVPAQCVAVKVNKFIGPPMVKMAKNILAKHETICKKKQY